MKLNGSCPPGVAEYDGTWDLPLPTSDALESLQPRRKGLPLSTKAAFPVRIEVSDGAVYGLFGMRFGWAVGLGGFRSFPVADRPGTCWCTSARISPLLDRAGGVSAFGSENHRALFEGEVSHPIAFLG